MPSLAGRLERSQRRNFVGREAELALFEQALTADEPPFVLLHVSGPGGIGKTSLLRQFELLTNEAGILAVYLNGELFGATPAEFLLALRQALPVEADDPTAFLAELRTRHVLLIDSFESISGLERWLRDDFLPQLSDQLLLVIADRAPLSQRWRYSAQWQPLIATRSLRNLPPDAARIFLQRQQVPVERHDDVLRFTYGHPLGMALVADMFAQRPDTELNLADNPDIVKGLLQRFVSDVPGPAHRAALDVAGLARVTTAALLADVLAMPDVEALFDWLRNLSFIESRPDGIVPHGLAREALTSDLKWRNPTWHAQLKDRLRAFYQKQLDQRDSVSQRNVLIDYMFLHRDSPVVRPFFERLQQAGGVAVTSGEPIEGDWPQLVNLIQQHEGDEAAAIAKRWFAAQPQNVRVFRDDADQIVGLMSWIELERADDADLQADPATRLAGRYLQENAPLREGERALYFRFWLQRDSYQSISVVQAQVFVAAVRRYLTTPGLAFSFFACADAQMWTPIFMYADLPPLNDVSFEVGGHTYGVFHHDWRSHPPTAWLDLLAAREGMQQPVKSAPAEKPTVVVLSRAAFGDALRDALNDLQRDDRLAGNPLLRSRLIAESAGSDATLAQRAEQLRRLIAEAAAPLQDDPRSVKYYRAFYHTYLQPAATQEAAAELIDVPFGSFRRHLKRAVTHVTDTLWQQELG